MLQRLLRIFRRRQFETEMDEEIRFHLERRVEDLMRLGLSRRDAERQARGEFGGVELSKDQCRTSAGFQLFDDLRADLHYTFRSLRKSPAFACVTIGVLAAGIGACTTIFSVVNSVLLRPLGYPEPEQLVRIETNNPPLGVKHGPTSYADATDWEKSGLFQSVGIYTTGNQVLKAAGRSENVLTGTGTSGLFRTLGVRAVQGRLFDKADDAPSQSASVLLTERLWRKIGQPEQAIGSQVQVNGRPGRVVGVISKVFESGRDPELWISPGYTDDTNVRQNRFWEAIGRLRNSKSLKHTEERLGELSRRLAQAYPVSNKDWGTDLVLLKDAVVGDSRTELLVLLGSVLFVMTIVCANTASLFIVRAAAREQELAVRAAIGASHGRIMRQVLTETAAIAIIGATLGCCLAFADARMLRGYGPRDLARIDQISVDLPTMLFAAVVAVLTGLIAGVAPAVQSARGQWTARGGRRIHGTVRQSRLRSALVLAEIALSIVLLTGSGLLIKTFGALLSEDPGFRSDHLLTAFLNMPVTKYLRDGKYQPRSVSQYADRVIQAIARIPGVSRVAAGTYIPAGGGGLQMWQRFWRWGAVGASNRFVHAIGQAVTPGYFETMQIPLLAGRRFTAVDTANANPVVIVNRSFARAHFGKQRAIGERIVVEQDTVAREIVGVVGDIKTDLPNGEAFPQVYFPFTQNPVPLLALFVRSPEDPGSLAREFSRQVRNVDPDVLPYKIRTQNEVTAAQLSGKRFLMGLMTGFAASAIALAVIGIYGLLAYSVLQRSKEFGVRLALGARPPQVTIFVLGQGLRLVLIGTVIGLGASLVATRAIAAFLYRVSPRDPGVLAGVTVLVIAAGLLSCWAPARRAASLDPAVALRAE